MKSPRVQWVKMQVKFHNNIKKIKPLPNIIYHISIWYAQAILPFSEYRPRNIQWERWAYLDSGEPGAFSSLAPGSHPGRLLHSLSLLALGLSVGYKTLVGVIPWGTDWSKYKFGDTYTSSASWISCNAWCAHLTCGNSHHFSKATDNPLHNPGGTCFCSCARRLWNSLAPRSTTGALSLPMFILVIWVPATLCMHLKTVLASHLLKVCISSILVVSRVFVVRFLTPKHLLLE